MAIPLKTAVNGDFMNGIAAENSGMELFHLKTFHGTSLFFCSEERILKHSLEKQPSYIDVVLVPFPEDPGFFLIAPVNLGEDVEQTHPEENNVFKDRFFVFTTGFHHDDTVSLLSLNGKKFFSADPFGNVAFNRDESQEWEVFSLYPSHAAVSDKTSRLFTEICSVFSTRNTPEQSLHAISRSHQNMRAELLNLFCHTLNADQRKQFSKIFTDAFLNLPDDNYFSISEIINHIPYKDWIHRALLELSHWNIRRTSRSFRNVPGEFDFLGYGHIRDRGNGIYWGAVLLGVVREAIRSRKDIALLATARDEGIYLLEWIAHHRVIGIKDFFIYTNDNTDGSDVLLKALSENKEITWIDNTGNHAPGINMQFKAYNHALTTLSEILDYRWCAVVDIDEAILPSKNVGNSIAPVIAARDAQGVDCFSLSWRVYYPNGHLTWENELSAERFVEGEKHPLVKSIFRTGLFNYSYAHHPECSYTNRKYTTVDGNYYPQSTTFSDDLNFSQKPTQWAYVCHYHLRSFEEYVWKFSRGENDGHGVVKNKHFRYNSPAIFNLFTQTFDVRGTSQSARLTEKVRAEIRRLASLPGVMDAMQNIAFRYSTASATFVEESLQSILADNRVDPDTKQAWQNLCLSWRKERAGNR
ncbi:hypothetical protein GFJ39_13890 [Gluconobacter sp. AC10]|uniref:Glycosyl transferase family 2 n=1 Tax=Gluconobacter aidae TaxID=2662454 RepID=A0A7X1VNX3_9PROT|nr:hypothetical protein [Gluconobacter aidae]